MCQICTAAVDRSPLCRQGMLALQEKKSGLARQALAEGRLGGGDAQRLQLDDLLRFFQ
jgi:hypothetical protein